MLSPDGTPGTTSQPAWHSRKGCTLRVDRPKWRNQAIRLGVKNLGSDNFERNSQEATRLLLDIGRDAYLKLVETLESHDEQQAVSAAGILSAQDVPDEVTPQLADKIIRLPGEAGFWTRK